MVFYSLGLKSPAFPEKLATKGTGRPMVAPRETAEGRLVIYPGRLQYRELLGRKLPRKGAETYYLELGHGSITALSRLWSRLKYLLQLIRYLDACREVALYVFSSGADMLPAFLTAAICRLKGRSVTLHDFSFPSSSKSRWSRLMDSLCRHRVIADPTALPDQQPSARNVTLRIFCDDLAAYRTFQKDRAVPRVIVYGNFENRLVLSLAGRTHDLIKEKYPRTELVLVSLTDLDNINPEVSKTSIIIETPATEDELRSIYSASDTVMLLSPGGVNRMFICRAQAAGFPIITNGFEHPVISSSARESIVAARDSYSALAGEITRLVDDEDYYRSFVLR
jgi:hypothetical protein